ncbi:IPT/TIG domain-containing protein [Crassaminicella indica]|uniref:IPT/TIG domain-containing protein n=1 Tax=Crassaminicella indica TaxID=2855394 RepID=A0ABX8REN3_9CLOT|nr:IPT/TIG domain-containing protein [Crassaminicella indica]QXM06757.1 IPT/TIG domain-containing protein [Crassaminicella indica]
MRGGSASIDAKIMKKYRICCLALTIMLIFVGIPIEYVHAESTGPQPISYTSSLNGTDDIRDLNKTKLDKNGSIYIKFSSNICFNDTSGIGTLTSKIHIFKAPKEFTYDVSSNQFTNSQWIEVTIGEAKIDSGYKDTLQIKLSEELSLRNQYKLKIDKGAVADEQGKVLANDIITTFWTKSLSGSQGIIIEKSDIKNVKAPKYGMDNPMILHVNGEVIPKAIEEQYDSNKDKFYEGSIKNISFSEIHDATPKVDIEKIRLDYYQEDNIKKTKVLLYPVYRNTSSGDILKNQLDSGKGYILRIPEGVFETRSGEPLEAFTQYFYVDTDPQSPRIDYLENNHFKVTDLYSNEGVFSIKGENFHDNIQQVKLKPFSGKASKEFAVSSNNFELKDATQIDVHIREELRTELAKESNTGAYAVEIAFDETSLTVTDKVYETVVSSVYATYNGTDKNDKIFLYIKSKGKPIAETEHPKSEDGKPWYDEKSLKHDVVDDVTKDKYFVKVIFDDLDGELDLTTDISDIKNCIIRPAGGVGNLVDNGFIEDILNMSDEQQKAYIGKYIFVKSNQQATLYIPIKPLRAQTNYQVIIPSGIVHYKDTLEENESFEWTFTTTAMPLIKGISVGTIPEDYDEDEPLYIHGDFFSTDSDKIKVYFDDIKAANVTVVSQSELKVYLPYGSDRLEPGTYDIIVENDINHKRTVYGSLGVVKAGDKEDIPNEEYRIKGDGREGEVRSNLKVSEDTLLISPSDINERELEFDLDELMGDDVLVRKIQYDGDKRCKIGMLKIKSKWADIILYGVMLDPYAKDDEITIRLGRVEPSVAQMLKRKLRGNGVASDFIQVSGENYKIKDVMLHIPLKYSNGKNIKALRYDEITRNFYEIPYTVNLIDHSVELVCEEKGIFIVANH